MSGQQEREGRGHIGAKAKRESTPAEAHIPNRSKMTKTQLENDLR